MTMGRGHPGIESYDGSCVPVELVMHETRLAPARRRRTFTPRASARRRPSPPRQEGESRSGRAHSVWRDGGPFRRRDTPMLCSRGAGRLIWELSNTGWVVRTSCDRLPVCVFRSACDASATATGRSARFRDRLPRSPCGVAGSGRTAAGKGMVCCGGNARYPSPTASTLKRKPFDRDRTDAGGFDLPVPELALRPCAVAGAGHALAAGRRDTLKQHTHEERGCRAASQEPRKTLPDVIDG